MMTREQIAPKGTGNEMLFSKSRRLEVNITPHTPHGHHSGRSCTIILPAGKNGRGEITHVHGDEDGKFKLDKDSSLSAGPVFTLTPHPPTAQANQPTKKDNTRHRAPP